MLRSGVLPISADDDLGNRHAPAALTNCGLYKYLAAESVTFNNWGYVWLCPSGPPGGIPPSPAVVWRRLF